MTNRKATRIKLSNGAKRLVESQNYLETIIGQERFTYTYMLELVKKAKEEIKRLDALRQKDLEDSVLRIEELHRVVNGKIQELYGHLDTGKEAEVIGFASRGEALKKEQEAVYDNLNRSLYVVSNLVKEKGNIVGDVGIHPDLPKMESTPIFEALKEVEADPEPDYSELSGNAIYKNIGGIRLVCEGNDAFTQIFTIKDAIEKIVKRRRVRLFNTREVNARSALLWELQKPSEVAGTTMAFAVLGSIKVHEEDKNDPYLKEALKRNYKSNPKNEG